MKVAVVDLLIILAVWVALFSVGAIVVYASTTTVSAYIIGLLAGGLAVFIFG